MPSLVNAITIRKIAMAFLDGSAIKFTFNPQLFTANETGHFKTPTKEEEAYFRRLDEFTTGRCRFARRPDEQ